MEMGHLQRGTGFFYIHGSDGVEFFDQVGSENI
jgi:hypothetical protein